MIEDYLRFNDYIDDEEDGFYVTKNGDTRLTSQQEIRCEEEFFPISSLVRQTFSGYAPDANKIEQMVSKYE